MKSIVSYRAMRRRACIPFQLFTLSFLIIALSAFSTSLFAQGTTACTAVSVQPGTHTANGPSSGSGAKDGCGFTGATHADWYKYTPVLDGNITVSSCTAVNTRLSIFTGYCIGTPFNYVFVGNCYDGDDNSCLFSNGSRIVDLEVTGGTTYYIQWDNKWSNSGFDWSLSYTPAPINDDPCGAFHISCGVPLEGTTYGASVSDAFDSECSGGSQKDVFYKFNANEGDIYTITVNGPDYNAVLAIYTASHCLSSLTTELACINNSASSGIAETITYTATETGPIFIQTYDWLTNGGDFTISLECDYINDYPCDPSYLTCGQTVLGSTSTSTQFYPLYPSCASGSAKSLFYSTYALADVEYTVTVVGANYDGVLAAYNGLCLGALTELDCSDSGIGNNLVETIHFSVPFSHYVLIQTYDWSASGGDFELNMVCENIPYDEPCEARNLICGFSFFGSSAGGTQSSVGPPTCENGSQNDVFFKFTAEANVPYTVTVNGDNYDGVLAAYTGSCDGVLTELDCSDVGSGPGIAETVDILVPTEQVIIIQTYDYNPIGQSDFSIIMNCQALDNDECVDAISLPVNAAGTCPANQVEGTTVGATGSPPSVWCQSGTPDVFYEFNSGSNSEVNINLDLINADDQLLSVFESSCSSEPIFCGWSELYSQTITVIPSTTYYVRVSAITAQWAGTYNICIEEAAPEIATINGTITGWNSSCVSRDVTVSVRNTSTLTTYIVNTTLSPSGTFVASSGDIPAGTYDILVKVQGALAILTEDVSFSAGDNFINIGPVVMGDISNNNAINVLDLSVFSASFGTTSGMPGYNSLADLNCDGVINIFDVSILGAGFNQTGDILPAGL